MSTLNATDLFVVRRGTQTYKVSYHDVLAGVVLPSVLTYMGATNPTAAAPAPAGGLKAGMTYVLTPSGKLAVSWTGIAGVNATDGQLAIWEGTKWELIGNTGAIPHATEAVSGIVELATAAETTTGTDNTRAVHPAGLKVELDKKAPLASPALTGTPTAPTAAAGTNTTQVATTAFVHAATPNASTTVHGLAQLADATAVTAGTAGRVVDAAQLKAVSDADDWTRTGTTVAPRHAGDVITVSAGTAALPGLTPVGDPDTGVWSPGADLLAISAGGAEVVRIVADGKVGIGTSHPGEILEVASTTPPSIRFAWRGATEALVGFTKDGMFRVSYGGTDRLSIDSNGNVGIGTARPNEILEVASTTPPAIRFSWRGAAESVVGFSTTGKFRIGYGGTDRLTISSTGVVNIASAPVYADNGAALAGGLVAGDIYRKADGTLMITF